MTEAAGAVTSTWSRRRVLGLLTVAAPAVFVACADGEAGPVARSGGAEITGPGAEPRPPEDGIAYGEGPARFGFLDLPDGASPEAGWPVAVLIHGGFWRTGHGPELMAPIAASLRQVGWATWNIQYSAVGDPEGGWPGTFDDVAAAMDHLARLPDAPLDLDRLTTIGHSAGGQLAMWAAMRPGLPTNAPGSGPSVTVRSVVSQAGVLDLVACVEQRLGTNACRQLMGAAPGDDPDRYRLASPVERLPSGVPTLLVHGGEDEIVPVSQSTDYAERARVAGDSVDLVVVDGADHFAPIESGHRAWTAVQEWLSGT